MKRKFFIFVLIFCASVAQAKTGDRFLGDGQAFDFALEIEDENAKLFLAEKPTNTPLADAKVSLQPPNGDAIVFAASKVPGVYEAKIAADAALVDFQMIVDAKGNADIIDLSPDTSGSNIIQPPLPPLRTTFTWSALLGGFAIGLAIGLFLKRNKKSLPGPVAMATMFAFSSVFYSKPLFAHSGHAGHGEAPTGAEAAVGSTIHMTKASQFLLGVVNIEAKKEKIKTGFLSYGHVIAKPQLSAEVVAPQSGILFGVQRFVLGEKVKKGQSLGVVDAVGQVRLSSPLDGELLEVNAVEGSRVEAGTKLFRITNTSILWVDAELFENQLSRLSQVSGISVALQDRPEGKRARLIQATTGISEETRTAKVYLEIDNTDGAIRVGSFATIYFALRDEREAVTVPSAAVLTRAGEQVVYVQVGPESYEARSVVTEQSSEPGKVIITNGVRNGDRVVVKGNYQLLMKSK